MWLLVLNTNTLIISFRKNRSTHIYFGVLNFKKSYLSNRSSELTSVFTAGTLAMRPLKLDPAWVYFDEIFSMPTFVPFCGVFVEIPWILGLWSRLSMNNIWFFSEIFYAWFKYLCKSLWIISLVWPTRLIFLAMGEVLSFGFNLVVSFPVTVGAARHVLYCFHRG